jgi:peptidoglycan/LPS O-acetylase OafA/YrhL
MAASASGIRADIQGLRAVAVLSVVVYHAAPRFLPGGFVGVDIFFVISGFLITGILLREAQSGRFSIAGFYERRVRRLFPALFVLLAACFAAGAALLTPGDFSELARTAASTVFFVSNIAFYQLSGYFDGASEDKPLLHTWSLAVEEQFYILYPLLLAFLWRFFQKRLLLILLIGTALAFAVSVWGAYEHANAAFYLTPFRAFELAIGAAAAVGANRLRFSPLARLSVSSVGAALIAFGLIFIDDATPFPGFAALAPCAGTALVILAGVNGASPAGRLLSAPPLTFFGNISYSLYLWHWPFLVFGRHALMGAPNAWQTALLVGAAIVTAGLSWKFVEQPFQRGKTPRRIVFATAVSAMAAASMLSISIIAMRGAPARFSPEAQTLFAAAEDYNHERWHCHNNEGVPIAYDASCVFGARGAAPVAAVWGDSSGAELVVALGESLERRGQAIRQITSSACAPTLGYQVPDRPTCDAHNRQALAGLLSDTRVRTVIISINFSRYPLEDGPAVFRGITQSVETLRDAGKTVVLVYPSPNPWIVAPRVLGLRAARGMELDSVGVPMETYANDNRENIAFLDDLIRRTGAIAFRPAETLCGPAFCPVYRRDVGVLYFNENHISITGARLALSRFPYDVMGPGGTDVSSR